MKRLLEGALEFERRQYKKHEKLFSELKDTQKPHTLFVGCADSRVIPNMITNTLPGELFVVRNIANIVPPYRESQEYLATTSAVEYALDMLEVSNVIVCGHSNCGGCAAIWMKDEKIDKIPHVKNWLKQLDDVKDEVLSERPRSSSKKLFMTELFNIKKQLRNLMTYPSAKRRFEEGRLNIYGWYFDIESGKVFNYNFNTGRFEPLNNEKKSEDKGKNR